ncbi:MAG TPA: methyltransferase domain-containing protein [Candidatus Saccharimonadales bacterium]|nr:methyltransferase domain-containing protein [Candidatus Saccharimonadales bacterium]
MQIAILGRQAGLSLAELEAIYGDGSIRPVGDYACLVDIDTNLPQDRLGGTVKSAEVLTTLKRADLGKAFAYLKSKAKSLHAELPDGKLKIGFSIYGLRAKPTDLSKKALEFKKVLKASGRSVRIVEAKGLGLSAAQVLYNKLTAELGREVLILLDGSDVIIARTTGVQDIDDYSARDFARPKRDARVGMLPPKLAQIMINMATGRWALDVGRWKTPDASVRSTERDSDLRGNSEGISDDGNGHTPRLLDPFCGTGVVLQEAALMGLSVYGSDIEKRMIDYTRDNLVWLEDKYGLKADKFFEVADATDHIWRQPIDLIVCEGYLGQPFSTEPSREKLEDVRHTTGVIMRKFLSNIAGQLNPGTRLVIGAPVWFMGGRPHHLKMLDDLEDLGYNRLSFVRASQKDLIYHREDQVVGRELLILTRK